MSTNAAPKHDTGNIQDVRDLQQMLANLQVAHDASVDQVSRLEADLQETRNKLAEVEEDAEAAQIEARTLRSDRNHLEREQARTEEDLKKATEVKQDETQELARIRWLIHAGKNVEALQRLDVVLSKRDSAWRCLSLAPMPKGQLDLFSAQGELAV